MSCWRSFGAAEFLDSCLRGLIVLVACIWLQVAVCFGQMSLTHFLDLGWWVGGLESVFFADTNTATIFIPHPLSIWE